MKIRVSQYNYDHELVKSIKQLVATKYSDLFYAVIVHGSFATNEVIKFSDFDGLIIVKDQWKASPKLNQFKKESMSLIYRFDPLQHHGWFQLLQSQLNDYPQHYLPFEILEHSKLVWPSDDYLDLELNCEPNSNYLTTINSVIQGLEIELGFDWSRKSLYDLKSHLSKVMLLPSLYYSVKNSKGIFKKDSFNKVKDDFSTDQWKVIESATQLRQNWKYDLSTFKKGLIKVAYGVNKKLVKHFLAPKIDTEMSLYLNTQFKDQLNLFLYAIKEKLK